MSQSTNSGWASIFLNNNSPQVYVRSSLREHKLVSRGRSGVRLIFTSGSDTKQNLDLNASLKIRSRSSATPRASSNLPMSFKRERKTNRLGTQIPYLFDVMYLCGSLSRPNV